MTKLPFGLYETLVSKNFEEAFETIDKTQRLDIDPLREAEAADRIAHHLSSVVERGINALPAGERVVVGTQLLSRIIQQIATDTNTKQLLDAQPVAPARMLRAVRRFLPDNTAEEITAPLIPLLDTTLLTNAPGEPRVGRQIQAEIASADRIDVVMAFIRRSGINPLREALRRHVEAGRQLRVLTTTYTGSTEAEALEQLLQLRADVRVSYEMGGTRLHAKAWLFHRESGFSTAYVGSSNLTHSAQVTGLEWNMRLSEARNRPVIEKIAAVFESYWQQPDFEPYDAARFALATKNERSALPVQVLSLAEIRLEPFQERLLEQVELAREGGHHRNLLVSATGTGKTVMAAMDYARLRSKMPRARLLFIAHREEILAQSRATFAHALRDQNFGELWVGGKRPKEFEHVFASVQALSAAGLQDMAPDHFDVVIVDEFHHAAAASYVRILDRLKPKELLGLTATPERSDGLPVLQWFDNRIAAELRLWDAIDQHRLTPFAYYGIADSLDLRDIPFTRGAGYDVEGVTNVITASDVWARQVVKQVDRYLGRSDEVRALGFCVSVKHAHYMARVFNQNGLRSVAVWSNSPDDERRSALTDLAAGRISFVFSVDLFNEGVDVPAVDALLMLRPTESPVLFLQQLGRGLRKSRDKSICTVLDFVGQHRKEFRYDRRFRALLGGSRAEVIRQVESGFPFLPAGCHMELDRVSSDRVLQSIRGSLPSRWTEKVGELRSLASTIPAITLGLYLDETGLDLDDVYDGKRSWTDLREAAGLAPKPQGKEEESLRRSIGRVLHVDDVERLARWRAWVGSRKEPSVSAMSLRDRRLLRMLLVQLFDQIASADTTLGQALKTLWSYPHLLTELAELFEVLTARIAHVASALVALPEVPLNVHAQYARLEILAACATGDKVKVRTWREGVLYDRDLKADLFVFTLDKTSGQFSPTTRYKDYALSRTLIHWESQSSTRAGSETGKRYQRHESLGSHVLLFGRVSADDRAFRFFGPARYVSHTGELPMAVTWRLENPLPGDVFQSFAAAVA